MCFLLVTPNTVHVAYGFQKKKKIQQKLLRFRQTNVFEVSLLSSVYAGFMDGIHVSVKAENEKSYSYLLVINQ